MKTNWKIRFSIIYHPRLLEKESLRSQKPHSNDRMRLEKKEVIKPNLYAPLKKTHLPTCLNRPPGNQGYRNLPPHLKLYSQKLTTSLLQLHPFLCQHHPRHHLGRVPAHQFKHDSLVFTLRKTETRRGEKNNHANIDCHQSAVDSSQPSSRADGHLRHI